MNMKSALVDVPVLILFFNRPAIVKPDEAFDIYEIDLSDEDAAAEE